MLSAFWHGEDLIAYYPLLLQGLLATVMLSLAVYLSALVLGVILAVIRFQRVPGLSQVGSGYVYLMRSIPTVMLIALMHFGILPMLGIHQSFFISAYVALTLSTTAYLGEILRGGFQAIQREELEGCISLGFTLIQRMRYVLVPLVLTRMLPALLNQLITLIKDTSLASIIGVIELTRAAEIITEQTLHEVTLLACISLVYFAMCYSLACLSRRLESVTAV